MGLDMYLNKKTYVKNWSHQSPEEQNEITIKKGGEVRTDIKPERISYITESVSYWRKFNALHQWFVDNCQDGNDNCQESDVQHGQLNELLVNLKKIDNDHSLAEELLPTQPGFFFGETEYDEYYFDNVKETIEVLEELLKEEGTGDFTYHASW